MNPDLMGRLRRWIALTPLGQTGLISAAIHRYPIAIISLFAILGVIGDSSFFESCQTSLISWGMLASFAVVLPAITSRYGDSSLPNVIDAPRIAVWISSAILATCVFGCWHAVWQQNFNSATIVRLLQQQPSQPVIVRGKLTRTVSLRRNPLAIDGGRRAVPEWQSQLTLALDSRRVGNEFKPVSGNVRVYVDGDLSDRRPGDRLEVYGWLQPFPAPTNPGAPDLRPSYRRLQLHGRIETKNAAAVDLIGESEDPIRSMVAAIATSGRNSLLRHTDDRTGALAVALVIGQREFVDPQTRNALLTTGTAHLLSVSGMHLAILVLVASWIISAIGLHPFLRFTVVVAISALYVAITGGRPPVMRAAILISMLLLSTCFRRTSQPLNTLAFAALVLVSINPLNVFAVGVHLSFLAVITLMLAGRPIAPGSMPTEIELQNQTGFDSLLDSSRSPWVRHAKNVVRFFSQMAWLSTCVTAISLPLVWSQFHIVSLISVITNVLVWGGLMVALPTGVMTVLFDPVHHLLGAVPGAVCHLALRYMWSVIEWTAGWRYGHFWLPAPSTPSVFIFYSVMAGSLLWRTRTAVWFRCGWVAIWGVCMCLVVTRAAPLPPATLEATFVDVRHGTSVILRTPDHKVWLYDCGRMGNASGSSRDIDTALWSLGITRLDAVFLSHADSDHYNALPGLLDRFSVDLLVTPPGMLARDKDGLVQVRSAIVRHRVLVTEVSDGTVVPVLVESGMSVLHPPPAGVVGSDNANSLVLGIRHQGKPLLLPGDIEPPGTETLISRSRPPADGVLMAPHHGSLSMNADAVLAWARPAETIVSGGKRAGRVEVREMLEVTGSGVHVTATDGAIRVRINRAGEIEVRSWLIWPW